MMSCRSFLMYVALTQMIVWWSLCPTIAKAESVSLLRASSESMLLSSSSSSLSSSSLRPGHVFLQSQTTSHRRLTDTSAATTTAGAPVVDTATTIATTPAPTRGRATVRPTSAVAPVAPTDVPKPVATAPPPTAAPVLPPTDPPLQASSSSSSDPLAPIAMPVAEGASPAITTTTAPVATATSTEAAATTATATVTVTTVAPTAIALETFPPDDTSNITTTVAPPVDSGTVVPDTAAPSVVNTTTAAAETVAPTTTAPSVQMTTTTDAPVIMSESPSVAPMTIISQETPWPSSLAVDMVPSENGFGDGGVYKPPTDLPVVYIPPDDDILDVTHKQTDWDTPNENLQQMEHDTNVLIALGVVFSLMLLFSIFIAHQMLMNPDGCCASICRLTTRCTCCVVNAICFPCRKLCGGGSRSQGHSRMITDHSTFGHELELS